MGLALKPLAARGLWANLHEAHIARVIGFGIIIALNPHHRIGNSKRHAIGFGVSCDQSTQIRGGFAVLAGKCGRLMCAIACIWGRFGAGRGGLQINLIIRAIKTGKGKRRCVKTHT